jgi:hypothetical protein
VGVCTKRERPQRAPRFIADERGESPEHGVYAKLNATKTEILNVYLDKKTACFDNGYTSSSGIDIAVKNKTLTRNHFYALFRECDPNLQETFLTRYCEGDADKLLLYKDGVGCSARAGDGVQYASLTA